VDTLFADAAAAAGFTVTDTAGATVDVIRTTWRGKLFSLDGGHPGHFGQAVLASELMERLRVAAAARASGRFGACRPPTCGVFPPPRSRRPRARMRRSLGPPRTPDRVLRVAPLVLLLGCACDSSTPKGPAAPAPGAQEPPLEDLKFDFKVMNPGRDYRFVNRHKLPVAIASREILEPRPEHPGTDRLHVAHVGREWLVEVPVQHVGSYPCALSPDRRHFATRGWDPAKEGRHLITVTDLMERRLLWSTALPQSFASLTDLEWQDDRTLLMAQTHVQADDDWRYGVVSVDVPTGRSRTLYVGEPKHPVFGIVPSSKGRLLLIHEGDKSVSHPQPYLVNVETGSKTKLPIAPETGSHSWTGFWWPDESLVYYATGGDTRTHCFARPGHPDKLVDPPAWVRPALDSYRELWFREDGRCCLVSDTRVGTVSFYYDDGRVEQLFNLWHDGSGLIRRAPSWSRDGRLVAAWVGRKTAVGTEFIPFVADTQEHTVTFFRRDIKPLPLYIIDNPDVVEALRKISRPGDWK
jgi:hypothetical protein